MTLHDWTLWRFAQSEPEPLILGEGIPLPGISCHEDLCFVVATNIARGSTPKTHFQKCFERKGAGLGVGQSGDTQTASTRVEARPELLAGTMKLKDFSLFALCEGCKGQRFLHPHFPLYRCQDAERRRHSSKPEARYTIAPQPIGARSCQIRCYVLYVPATCVTKRVRGTNFPTRPSNNLWQHQMF